MNRPFCTVAGEQTRPSAPSEAWHFAQHLLGKPVSGLSKDASEARASREQSEWLADVSPEHEHRLRASLSEQTAARSERRQLEWLAGISSKHQRQLRRLVAAEAEAAESQGRVERLLEYFGVCEAQWDPAKHPRLGGPPNAGWFATTGGSGRSGSSKRSGRPAPPSPTSREPERVLDRIKRSSGDKWSRRADSRCREHGGAGLAPVC